eukprot:gene34679-42773_t
MDDECPGMICRGPPGIGKSHMAMYFLCKLLADGYTVVYEKVKTETVYVIPPTGECRVFRGSGTVDYVPEFYKPNTIHLFDDSAENQREAVINPSKMLIMSHHQYPQYCRLGAPKFTLPSYTREELDKRREFFPVMSDDEYHRKLEIGGVAVGVK